MQRSLTGTALMTVFSYLLTAATQKDCREPGLLAKMFRRSGAKAPVPKGWAAHVGAGLAWAPVLTWLNNRLPAHRPLMRSLVLGIFSGITAVGAWKLLFTMHHRPPKNDRTIFYLQLIAAHWIFSLPFSADRSPRLSPPGNRRAGTL